MCLLIDVKEQMPKSNRYGKAKIWTDSDLEQVLSELDERMRCLFSICLYTGCRISEARQLRAENIVNDCIVFQSETTKGGKRTRKVEMNETLKTVFGETELPATGYLFTGKNGGCITRQTADAALRKACDLTGLRGYSTHSFRRTALTRLSNAGVPLRVIQEISGHADLGVLQKYLEVSPAQVKAAISNI